MFRFQNVPLINGTQHMFKNIFIKIKQCRIIRTTIILLYESYGDKKKMKFFSADLVIFGCVCEVLYQ